MGTSLLPVTGIKMYHAINDDFLLKFARAQTIYRKEVRIVSCFKDFHKDRALFS